MATPQSTTGSVDDGQKKHHEQITFRFCSECSNMLYPKENEDTHKLQFTCRTCQYTEEATSTCVFRNVLNNAAGETAGVTQDVGSDPTVSACASVSGAYCACNTVTSPFPFFDSQWSLDTPPLSPVSTVATPEHGSPATSSRIMVCLCCGDVISCVCCGCNLVLDSTPLPSPAMRSKREVCDLDLAGHLRPFAASRPSTVADLGAFSAFYEDDVDAMMDESVEPMP